MGSVGFFFHENRPGTTNDEPSRVAGSRRFQCGVNEIRARIGRLGSDAELLVTEIVELEQQLASDDPGDVQEAAEAMEVKEMKLTQVKKDIGVLEAFYTELNAQWSDIWRRDIGHVHWAPKISVDVEGYRYTRDFGTFELDEARFKTNFKGNVVDLGAFCLIFLIITSSDKNDF
jgi:hypothetical protein